MPNIKSLTIALLGSCSLLFAQQTLAAPTHSNPQWQSVSDISWSTDGINWGNNDVHVGDTIYFKFDLFKETQGSHYGNLLKAWIDWNQDGTFTQDESSFFYEIVNVTNPALDYTNTPVNSTHSFITSGFTLIDEGSFDMLVRATCTESALDSDPAYSDEEWGYQWSVGFDQYDTLFKPDGHLHQGNLMTSTLNVLAVPEPETYAMMLLGLGMIAAVVRRRRQ
ncbi:MAG: PEP-CTERM sorting domain-containing protein [Azonexus sp.]|jgi:hypothetical protein|nr:PEP-CTERM sorting domain-containing protein [Azonexus sp.]